MSQSQLKDDVRSAVGALLALVAGSIFAQWVSRDFWDAATWATTLGVWIVLGMLWITVRQWRRRKSPPQEP